MSAWRIGAGKSRIAPTSAARVAGKPAGGAVTKRAGQAFTLAGLGLDALTRWLPAEVVALYAAIVAAMQPRQEDGKQIVPEVRLWPWLLGIVATLLVVLFGAKAADNTDKLLWRLVLAGVAFVLWSATVPYSAWYLLPWIDLAGMAFWGTLTIVVVVFTKVAQWAVPTTDG